jgi:hypothetical protein
VRLIRSWPSSIPAGRAYVEDDCDRQVMDDFTYRWLADYDDDLVLIEWDLAVGKEDLAYFAAGAARRPEEILVAPYKLYFAADNPNHRRLWGHVMDRCGAVWAHMHDPGNLQLEPVADGDPFCSWFGFGLIYLPRGMARQYLEYAQRFHVFNEFTDSSFSLWHQHAIKRDVPICWEVRPKHLHYTLEAAEVAA